MHDLKTIYEKILELLRYYARNDVNERGNYAVTYPAPKMSDIEIIALAVSAEILSINSERLLFSKLKTDYSTTFTNLIDRTRYNRRRRGLKNEMLKLNRQMSLVLDLLNPFLLVDSMPCPIVKNSRERSFKICKEAIETSPKKGYSAVDKRYFIGYKLHLLTTENGVFRDMQISPANVHDIHFIKTLKPAYNSWNKCLIADKGYISQTVQTSLFDQYKIELKTPLKANQKGIEPPRVLMRKRKRIEVLFSQLTDQFNIKHNYAKSFDGYHARIIAKITAITVLQTINESKGLPLNRIKYAMVA